MKRLFIMFWGLLVWMVCVTYPGFPDGIFIAPVGVNIAVKYHHVSTAIRDQIATTEIDQVFLNDSDQDSLEVFYIFPLPEGATFNSFSMFVDDKELTAEVLSADSARAIYESIVRRNLDPALLEYIGLGLFQARIFPVRAYKEKRVKISYSEFLQYDNGLVRYVYPLATEKHSSKNLEAVSVTVTISSNEAIKTIFSPTHQVQVEKTDDFNARVLYAEADVLPAQDFILYYTVSPEEIGMHLLTYRPNQEDGFYLFTAAPKQSVADENIITKRIIFVLDRSGSMSGAKVDQARQALKFVLQNLNENDRFNIVDFSTEVKTYNSKPLQADATNIGAAVHYVDQISASGGTNINDALVTALGQMVTDSLTNMIIFLTDGLPTVGETNIEMIRQNVQTANIQGSRIFAFGVGYDVNTHLLDNLVYDNHGVSTYVRPEEDIEIAVSSFFTKISSPVLANLSLDFGTVAVYDRYPGELPDLFEGSQVLQLGRYQDDGATTITLAGTARGDIQEFTYLAEFPAIELKNDFIARLWALRKIGYLLDAIRLHGDNDEIIAEIVRLSKKYGIITPYTSFLILEDEVPPGAFSGLGAETGRQAFDFALTIGDYRGATSTSRLLPESARYIGGKAFFLRNDFWIDSDYIEGQVTTKFEFGSEAYFAFLDEHPELAKYFSIGKNVIVSQNNKVFQVHEKGKEYEPIFPTKYKLLQNYPNPFNPITWLSYEVNSDAWIKIQIFDVTGRKVHTLVDAFKQVGIYRTWWYGQDSQGRKLPGGIYFCQMMANGMVVKSIKMLFIK